MPLTPLWLDRHPRDARPDVQASTPGLLGDDPDVVVVGAGITGLTTALLLARGGQSVTVLEGRYVGAGTTGGSTAKVSLLQGTRVSRIERRHSADVAARYVEANAEGQAWLAQFCSTHGVGTQRRPAFTFATTARGERDARREHEALLRAGLAAQWTDAVDLPFAVRGATRLDDQLQLDPVELLDALAAQCRDHGVRIVEGARVRRVRGHGPVRVETDLGTVAAGSVVVATNLPMLDRGGWFARVTPARSYGLAFRTAEQPVDAMYLSAETPSRSLRDAPDASGPLLLVGGNGHRPGAPVSEAGRLDTLRRWTLEHFPGAEETHAWSAQDYLPHHDLPFAGPVLPGEDRILVAGGFAKWGLTNGVAAALALAGRLLGGQHPWASVYDPWRARELRGAARGVRANGEVGLEMTWGWMRPVLHPGVGVAPGEGDGVVRAPAPGLPVAVSRTEGVERRVSAVCTHLGGVVRWNDAEKTWDCPLHASRFDADGEVLDGPATCGLRRRG